jgi:hypothetical protein
VPVPTITPNTTSSSAPAPSMASESAKQFASLASRTGRERAAERSSANGRPMSHCAFAFFITPLAGEMAPGVPTPTVARRPHSRSIECTRPAIAASVAP